MKSLIVLFALLPASVAAQALPTDGERKAAEIASYVTAIVPVVLDAKVSWDCPERLHCFEMQGLRIGTAYGIAFLAKTFIREDRPCAPRCGVDAPNKSFFSGHTMLPFTATGGPSFAIVLPFGAGTGALRVLADKHYWWDVAVGAGVGLATSRIR